MGDEQMKLWDDEETEGDEDVASELTELSASQEPISTIGSDQNKEKITKINTVEEYFKSIAPEIIEITMDNYGLYHTLETAMNKSNLEIRYDRQNRVHYVPNTPPFLARYLSQVLQENGLPDDSKIIGNIIHNTIGSKMIIKEGHKTKDGQALYRLNPHIKKLPDIDEDEANRIFAKHLELLAENIEKEKITQIASGTTGETSQDTLTGFEWPD